MLDTKYKLSKQTVILHWLIALLIIALLVVGIVLSNMERSPAKGELMMYHKSFGLIVLVLASWRLIWRLINGFIKPLPSHHKHEIMLAHTVVVILLVASVLMPLSGVVMTLAGGHSLDLFGLEIGPFAFTSEPLANFAKGTHGVTAVVLMVAIGLHILGTIKHAVIDKDQTLNRIKGKDIFSTAEKK